MADSSLVVLGVANLVASAALAFFGNAVRAALAKEQRRHEKEMETIKRDLGVLAATKVNSHKLYDDLRFRYAVEVIEDYVVLNEAVDDFNATLTRLCSIWSSEGPETPSASDAARDEKMSHEALLEARAKFLVTFRARRMLLPPELIAVVDSAVSSIDEALRAKHLREDLPADLTRAAEAMADKMRRMLGIS